MHKIELSSVSCITVVSWVGSLCMVSLAAKLN